MIFRQLALNAATSLKVTARNTGTSDYGAVQDAVNVLRGIGVHDPLPEQIDELEVWMFKPSGKYYTLEVVPWSSECNSRHNILPEVFKKQVLAHLNGRLKGMTAVCLDFPHPHSCPCSFVVPDTTPSLEAWERQTMQIDA